jgi:putative transposase
MCDQSTDCPLHRYAAYAESLFRTCKYRPNYPAKSFESVEQARKWTWNFVQWYNHQHKHSGLKFVTPAQAPT